LGVNNLKTVPRQKTLTEQRHVLGVFCGKQHQSECPKTYPLRCAVAELSEANGSPTLPVAATGTPGQTSLDIHKSGLFVGAGN